MSYDAFISYAHGVDGVLAESIQRELGRLARPWHRRVALRVFRDATSLSAAPGLWAKLTATMDETAWFVLVASPAAAGSLWVNREAAYWLESHGPDQVILVLAEGSMHWDALRAQFDPATSTALPAALIDAFPEEPLFVDVRDERDVGSAGTRDQMFRGCVAQIAAPIHGVSKEDLFGEEARQQKRTVRLVKTVVATLAALALVATSAGFLAIRSAHSANRARIRSDRARVQSDRARIESDYERLLAQSRSLRGTDPSLPLLLGLEAIRSRNTQTSRNVLQGALVASGPYLGAETDRSKSGTHNALCMLDPYRVGLVADSDGTVTFVDFSTARPVGKRISLPGWNKTHTPARAPVNGAVTTATDHVMGCAVSPDRRRAVVFSRSGLLWRIDVAHRATTGSPIRLGVRPNQVAILATSPSVLVGSTDGKLLIGSFDEPVARWKHGPTGTEAVGVAFSPDGTKAATTTRDQVTIWNPTNWTELSRLPAPPDDQGGLVAVSEQSRLLSFSPDSRLLGDSRRDVMRLYDLDRSTTRWSYSYPYGTDAQPFAFVKNAVLFSGLSSSFLSLDLETGRASPTSYDTHNSDLQTIAVSADGRTLFSAATGGHSIQRFALDGRRSIARFIRAPGMRVQQFSPDGSSALLVPMGASFVVPSEVVDVATGRSLGKVPTAGAPQLMSRTTVAGYFVDKLLVDRIDATTSNRIGPKFPIDISRISSAAVDGKNGRVAIINRDGTVDVYGGRGTAIGTPWLKLPENIKGANFSPDGSRLAIERSDARVNIYQVDPRRLLATTSIPMDQPSFTPDGKLLGGFTKSGTAFTFADATTGKPVGPDLAGTGAFLFPDFRRGHRFLLAGDEVGQVYDRASRSPIGETFSSTSLPALRPGGDLVATSTADGIVLWDFDQAHWAPIACRIAGRNLTRAEWKTYLPNTSYRRTCTRWPSGR